MTSMIAVSAHEQAVLDEFELLRHKVPERLRIVVDELADEHVVLLRLCNGDAGEVRRREGDDAMRAMAKRRTRVWLVTGETENPPVHAQVLDLSIGRLYPPHPYEQHRQERLSGRRCRSGGRTSTSTPCWSASR